MNQEYLWGGALAGLLIIAVVGAFLAVRSSTLRGALSAYIGELPARWLLYLIWFVYCYGVFNAVVNVVSTNPLLAEQSLPTFLSFAYGTVSHSLLVFVRSIVPLVHIVALTTVALLLYRHLKTATP